jgi:hypothetical protein
LPHGHLQTVWGRYTRPKQLVPFQREVLETPDGDDLVLDHAATNGAGRRPAPRLILLHGLEGSSYSVYMQGLLALAAARGWRGTAVNFRSCARDPSDILRMLPNKRPRMYHSGETTDFDFVARTLSARDPESPLFAAGVSLGGNALLKWLGEHPGQTIVKAAATLSVPYDLAAGSTHLETPVGRFYLKNFLKTLKPKALAAAKRFPEAAARIDVARTKASQTFWEYDDAVTGPLHGFQDALDYYTRSSSLGFVDKITTPALCVSAADDPFLPRQILEQVKDRMASCVELVVTPRGGHAGFITGPHPWKPRFWAEELVISWLAERI